MARVLLAVLIVAVTIVPASRTQAEGTLAIDGLRIDRLIEPLGLGDQVPRFAWRLTGDGRDLRQTAYRLLVGSTRDVAGDMWDSGRVASDDSSTVAYQGKPLVSATRYFWRVQIWDEDGVASDWSAPASFEMGLLEQSDWTAQWIRSNDERNGGAYYGRKDFVVAGPLAAARLNVSALGLYELHLNGARVGDQVLAPGWTDYDLRVASQTYDVTSQLHDGDNTLGAIVGGGWYVGPIKGGRQYRGRPALIAQLDLTYDDGHSERIGTDTSWQFGGGSVQSSWLYYGERVDARLDQPGWDMPGFQTDTPWQAAEVRTDDLPPIEPAQTPPIRVVDTLQPVTLAQPLPNVWVFDFGQNFAGWVRVHLRGPGGTEVHVSYGEELNADGTPYDADFGPDYFTLRGGDVETFEPRFTYHGFRYAAVTGLPDGTVLDTSAVEGRVISTDLPDFGQFSTSNETVNQIQHLIEWGARSNYLAVPTDTPHRAERLGWTGDAQAFASTGAFNSDVSNYLGDWLQSLRESQRTDGALPDIAPFTGIDRYGTAGWGDAATIVPWTLFQQYGDKRVLADNYPMMTGWLAYLQANSTAGVRPADGYGDWYAPPPIIGGTKGSLTPMDVVATAFFAHSADLTSRAATALGLENDATRYRGLYEDVRTAFIRQWVGGDGRIANDSQGAYVLALAFGLVPDELRTAVVQRLVEAINVAEGHLQTGFLATPFVLSVLAANGRTDVAYRVLEQDTYPSWGYELRQGATTPWEQWDGKWPDGRVTDDSVSFNHYALASIGDFLYRSVGGLAPDGGYQHVIVQPLPGPGVTSASTSVASTYGVTSVAWQLVDGRLAVDVQLPPNTSANVYLPGQNGIAIGSGSYHFETLR